MFISLPAIESEIDELIAASRYNDALATMLVGVHNHYTLPEAEHRFLYYPCFDKQIQRLADILDAAGEPSRSTPVSRNTLIVASLLQQVGGHSRVIEDVAREVELPTLVITDMFWTYRNTPDQLNWLLDSFDFASVIVLTQRSLWAKCGALRRLTERLQPRNILYFGHHQDPIPFVGTLGHSGSQKTLIHHCDHNPSLGNTLAGIKHADFSEELARTCSNHLNRDARLLPLYVPDAGRKRFAPAKDDAFSVVTSGTSNKFARTGAITLQAIAQTVLSAVRGNFFHIGPLDEEWVAEIKAHLEQNAIDPGRFVPLGPVTSLWTSLASLDALLYLGSAPVGGGRAAIEAQGCGYPVLFFRVIDPGSSLEVESLYANRQLGWSTLSELSALLTEITPRLAQLSDEARSFYDQRYSHDQFARTLKEITAQ